jgi:hypothetical protein
VPEGSTAKDGRLPVDPSGDLNAKAGPVGRSIADVAFRMRLA